MGLKQVLSFRVKVDLEVMAMKEYSTLPELQKWGLIIRCSLVSYSRHLFSLVGVPFRKGYSRRILSSVDRAFFSKEQGVNMVNHWVKSGIDLENQVEMLVSDT